jgi:hypothetical protein
MGRPDDEALGRLERRLDGRTDSEESRIMTTELATVQDIPGTLELAGEPLSPLAQWANNARLASQVAAQLVATPFVPASLLVRSEDNRGFDYERSVGNILGALLVGDELGLAPMAALRSIDIVNGTPAIRALGLRAVVQAAGHELVLVESGETRAIVKGRRHGRGEWQQSTWTLDRARKLNLAGKQNWRNQPEAMLIARATAECARLVASDAILGLAYSVEELADELAGVDGVPEQALEQPEKRTARRRSAQPAAVARPPVAPVDAAPDPEPDFDEPGSAEPPAETPDPITKPQLSKLHAQLNDLGITDRADGLALYDSLIGHPVASSKDLTKDEASLVIDELDRRLLAEQSPTAEES